MVLLNGLKYLAFFLNLSYFVINKRLANYLRIIFCKSSKGLTVPMKERFIMFYTLTY